MPTCSFRHVTGLLSGGGPDVEFDICNDDEARRLVGAYASVTITGIHVIACQVGAIDPRNTIRSDDTPQATVENFGPKNEGSVIFRVEPRSSAAPGTDRERFTLLHAEVVQLSTEGNGQRTANLVGTPALEYCLSRRDNSSNFPAFRACAPGFTARAGIRYNVARFIITIDCECTGQGFGTTVATV